MSYYKSGYKAYCVPAFRAPSFDYCAPAKSFGYRGHGLPYQGGKSHGFHGGKGGYVWGKTHSEIVIKFTKPLLDKYCPPLKPHHGKKWDKWDDRPGKDGHHRDEGKKWHGKEQDNKADKGRKDYDQRKDHDSKDDAGKNNNQNNNNQNNNSQNNGSQNNGNQNNGNQNNGNQNNGNQNNGNQNNGNQNNGNQNNDCTDCRDDGNQTNKFGGIDTQPGNIIKGENSEDGVNKIIGTAEKDTIHGSAAEDIIKGGDGPDVIYAEGGNDTVHGENRGDTLYGGPGKDYLNGGNGHDYLNGGLGDDIMRGGNDNDVYMVQQAGDVVIEEVNQGNDTVRTYIDYELPDNVENLILMGEAGLKGTGNSLDNNIDGNGGANSLYGMGGNDCLVGKDGNDYLDGGLDEDILLGGKGDDTYFFAKDYGQDIITDAGGDCDVLSFGGDISMSDLCFERDGNSLNITLSGNEYDKVTVSDWFSGTSGRIETFTFADGSSMDSSAINAKIQEQTQTGGII